MIHRPTTVEPILRMSALSKPGAFSQAVYTVTMAIIDRLNNNDNEEGEYRRPILLKHSI